MATSRRGIFRHRRHCPGQQHRLLDRNHLGDLSSKGTDSNVFALKAEVNGYLYAGGKLQAGGFVANRMARWKDLTWSAPGSGMSNKVLALALGEDQEGLCRRLFYREPAD